MIRRLIIVLGLVLVLGGGAVAGLWYTGRLGARGEAPPPATVLSLGEFVTNLDGDGGRRFIRVRIDVEAVGERPQRELEGKSSLLRDAVFAVLRAQSYDKLSGEQGMRGLEAVLLERLNALLESVNLRRVFFVEFVIQ
jgi:flagellar basal body-associated protein FliL